MKRLIAIFITFGIIIFICTYMFFYLLGLTTFWIISLYTIMFIAYLLICCVIFFFKTDAAYTKTCSMLSNSFCKITRTNKFVLARRIRNFKYAQARLVFNEIEIEFTLPNNDHIVISTNDYLWFIDNFKTK